MNNGDGVTEVHPQTVQEVVSLIKTKDSSKNYFISSSIPQDTLKAECVLGIDEAGRGPVLGPMVYGVCFCPKSVEGRLREAECADSKTLSESDRERIFEKLCSLDSVGWHVEVLSPVTISNEMLKREKVSLNELSHNSAIGLVRRVLEAGVNLTEIFVDTVGPAEKYQDKLSNIFPGIKVTVSKKADALFPTVSAASICAKVVRDLCLREWTADESVEGKYGSGYPNDPVTKEFLRNNLQPIFGFPSLVRFSWSTAAVIIEENGVLMEWDESEVSSNQKLSAYFTTNKPTITRCSYFSDRRLENVTTI